ncbi:MAG: 30S ribosomal protein S8e [Candidatus Woesearchaeota archaeon]
MANDRTQSLRKASGGRKRMYRKARQYARVNDALLPKVDVDKKRSVRTIGGNTKFKLLSAKTIYVTDTKKKTVVKAQIESVITNQANKNYEVRNIINKGTIVKTSAGTVKITSRPGQFGVVNGVLVE